MTNGKEIMFCNVIDQQKNLKEYFNELRRNKRDEREGTNQMYFYCVGSKMILKKKSNVELKIDIDEIVITKKVIDRIKTINGLLNLGIRKVDVRKTKKGCHLRMITNCRRLGDMDVLLIQGLMGDDYKRGCLNYKRVMRGETNWNVLFNKKWGSDGKVKSKEGIRKITEI